MSDETSEIRQEMAATRDRMARDVHELESRAKDGVQSATRRLDVAQLVREHPWPALGAAVVLGAVVAGSGADRKAASATAAGAKHAASAAKEAAAGVVAKLHSHKTETGAEEPIIATPKRGLGERLFDVLSLSVAGTLARVLDEMRVASRSWGARAPSSPPSRRATGATAPFTVVAIEEDVIVAQVEDAIIATTADIVPVPNEMMPSEIDARADAVEALGGGTHEPPLAPGAGDLGARWA